MRRTTGLCVVWYLIIKARGDVFYSEIERHSDSNDDTFTNEYCNNCSSFDAEVDVHQAGRCKCKADKTDSLFLRSERRCKSGWDFKEEQEPKCCPWDWQLQPRQPSPVNVKVINVTDVNPEHRFARDPHSPCHLTSYIAYLDVTGNWTKFNLSGNVFKVENGNLVSFNSKIKITQKSPSLTNLSGRIIKLGLNCTGQNPRETCLLFRVKGVVKFPLCNYTLPSTFSPSPTRFASSTAHVNITSTPSVNTPITTTKPPSSSSSPTVAIKIIAITLGAVLFLVLIGAVLYFLYKQDHICKSRERQANMGVAVISNPAQQSNRENEEHVYDDLLGVCSSNEQISGNSVEMKELKQSEEKPILLVSNPYVTDSSLSGSKPLPFRPDQNNDHNVVGQGDVSLVLENPGGQESQSESLLRVKDDFVHQQESSEETEVELEHHQHQHHHGDAVDGTEDENPDLYQGLKKGNRAQSMFICPSCNANSDYQRLSRPGHCPHEGNQEREEKSRSFYESLTTERGARESVYMNPSRADEEDQDNANKIPDYHTLEPDETEPNDAQEKPSTHDYNVLEEPEQASIEPLDEDKKQEPPVSPRAENSPVYEEPCKKKTSKKVESGSSGRDEENNKVEDVCLKDKDPNEMLDPSVFVKVGDNPANVLPGTAKEAASASNKVDEERNKVEDGRSTDEDPSELLDPSQFLDMDYNPAYALYRRKTTDDEAESACCELDEEKHEVDDTRL
ncbi:hypothetical protein ABFA07_012415 [Porites harrisoni]